MSDSLAFEVAKLLMCILVFNPRVSSKDVCIFLEWWLSGEGGLYLIVSGVLPPVPLSTEEHKVSPEWDII